MSEPRNCPFCGSHDVDAEGWVAGDGRRGPECMECGAMAASLEDWTRRQPISEEALADVIACTLYGGEFQTPDQVYAQLSRHQNKTVVDLAKRIIAHMIGKAGT